MFRSRKEIERIRTLSKNRSIDETLRILKCVTAIDSVLKIQIGMTTANIGETDTSMIVIDEWLYKDKEAIDWIMDGYEAKGWTVHRVRQDGSCYLKFS